LLKREEERLKQESKAAIRVVCKNMVCLKRLEKQKRFLKSKGKDMLCYGLRTLDKLEEAKEKEKQVKEKRAAKAAATLFALTSNLLLTSNPFAKLEVPLLPPKV
jgi:hypothetical protein